MRIRRHVRITHRPSGVVLADGVLGWGITPWEGNYYISAPRLRDGSFRSSNIPGVCPYKGLYVWMDLHLPDGSVSRMLGWKYWLPNPLLPFTWYRVALPGNHPDLSITFGEAGTWQARAGAPKV